MANKDKTNFSFRRLGDTTPFVRHDIPTDHRVSGNVFDKWSNIMERIPMSQHPYTLKECVKKLKQPSTECQDHSLGSFLYHVGLSLKITIEGELKLNPQWVIPSRGSKDNSRRMIDARSWLTARFRS